MDWILISILLGSLGAIINLILDKIITSKFEKKQNINKIILSIKLIIIILCLIISLFIYSSEVEDKKYNSNEGDFEIESNIIFPVINYGNNVLYNVDTEVIDIRTPFSIFFDKEGQMIVNVELYNEEGDVFAIVSNNEWILFPQNGGLMKNFDKNGFEIIGDKNQVIFQLDFINDSMLYISGDFYDEFGSRVYVSDQGIYLGYLEENNIKKIFKYPTMTNKGVRI